MECLAKIHSDGLGICNFENQYGNKTCNKMTSDCYYCDRMTAMMTKLAYYEKTNFTPEEIVILQVENAEMIDVITGSRECRYCKSYPFCCDGDWICLTPDNVKFEWRGLSKMGK